MKLLNLLRKEGKNFHFDELYAEILKKDKSLENINESVEASKRLFSKRGSELKRKEKLLKEKASLLNKLEQALRKSEDYIKKQEEKFKKTAEGLQVMNIKLEAEINEKEAKLGKVYEKSKNADNELIEKEKELQEQDSKLITINNEIRALTKVAEELGKDSHKLFHSRLHNELLLMLDTARVHIGKESFDDVKHAYNAIRSIYSKLSPEGKEKMHGDILRLKEDIIRKFYHRQ